MTVSTKQNSIAIIQSLINQYSQTSHDDKVQFILDYVSHGHWMYSQSTI